MSTSIPASLSHAARTPTKTTTLLPTTTQVTKIGAIALLAFTGVMTTIAAYNIYPIFTGTVAGALGCSTIGMFAVSMLVIDFEDSNKLESYKKEVTSKVEIASARYNLKERAHFSFDILTPLFATYGVKNLLEYGVVSLDIPPKTKTTPIKITKSIIDLLDAQAHLVSTESAIECGIIVIKTLLDGIQPQHESDNIQEKTDAVIKEIQERILVWGNEILARAVVVLDTPGIDAQEKVEELKKLPLQVIQDALTTLNQGPLASATLELQQEIRKITRKNDFLQGKIRELIAISTTFQNKIRPTYEAYAATVDPKCVIHQQNIEVLRDKYQQHSIHTAFDEAHMASSGQHQAERSEIRKNLEVVFDQFQVAYEKEKVRFTTESRTIKESLLQIVTSEFEEYQQAVAPVLEEIISVLRESTHTSALTT